MKKIILVLILLNFSFLFAQATVDPNDYFYSQAQIWMVQGLVKNLPPLRPYKLSVINDILNTVIENGNSRESEIAKSYYESINEKPWSIELSADFKDKIQNKKNESNENDYLIDIKPYIKGNLVFLEDFVSFGYKLGWSVRTDANTKDFLPLYKNPVYDAKNDPATVSIFKLYLDTDEVVSIGNSKIFAQGGLYRPAYGDFLGDGLALSESNFHSGNLSFTYLDDLFHYSQLYSVIGATRSYDGEKNLSPDKYIAFHEVGFNFFDKFYLNYYENIVYGNRFDYTYILPVPYMAAQGIGGYDDNLQMGINFKYLPVNNIQIATDVIVDDLSVNELAKFNLDSRYRVGGKVGVIYTPNIFLSKIDLNYTLIAPYTYSHWQYEKPNCSIFSDTVNYQNCTNNGINIGTTLDPNSEKISLNFDFRPLPKMVIKLTNSFIRHGNVCENYSDDEILTCLMADSEVYATDGSIYTHSMFENSKENRMKQIGTAENHLNLLNQNHIMTVYQSGIEMNYELPKVFNAIYFGFDLGYHFQYVHNYGVSEHLYPGNQIVKNSDGSYTWAAGSKVYSNKEELKKNSSEIANYYKDKWIDNLTDLFANYINIGFTIKY